MQMNRSVCLGILTVLGVVVTAATYQARQARVPMQVHEVADNLYMLASVPGPGMRTGGNTAVFVTSSGVTLVDTKLAGYGPDILAEVRKLTDQPVTRIINTHTHYDHSGSNTEFPDSITFVAHENTHAQMARGTCEPVTNCDAFKGENAKYLPTTTFSDRTSLSSGADQIDLYYFGRGHTDGDTFVVFRAARAMHTGDMFARKGLPFIDAENGNGSAVEFGSTLSNAIGAIRNVDTIIPGHADAPMAWSDLVDYAGFYNDLLGKIRQGSAAGRSVDDVVEAYTVPDRYRGFQAPEQRLRAIVELVANEQ